MFQKKKKMGVFVFAMLLAAFTVFTASSEARGMNFEYFSMNAPSNWLVEDDDESVIFVAPDSSAWVMVMTVENDEEMSLQETAESMREAFEGQSLKKEGNIYTFQFEYKGIDSRAAVAGNEIFMILAAGGSGKDIDRILNSFQTAVLSDQLKREMLTSLDVGGGNDRRPVKRDAVSEPAEENTARTRIWNEYVRTQSSNSARIAEMRNGAISFGGVTMRFAYSVIGSPDDNGYPLFIALHGGGGDSAQANSQQYEHMKSYYKDSVDNGVYVAVRAVRDTWNCHFNPESFPIYDRLIENMILFENIDPNRVYLMGFSAGGDGVYGITPRMADRFAAVSMSAGHHNSVKAENFMNTPIIMQCGDNDTNYERHLETAKYGMTLAGLQRQWPGHFIHKVNIHVDKGHAISDNDADRNPYRIWRDSAAWLSSNSGTISENTNAVDFLIDHTRRPLPQTVIWDLSTRANMREVESFYWLRAGADMDKGTIIAKYDAGQNAISITTQDVGGNFYVLLNQEMVDYGRPVTLAVNGRKRELAVESSDSIIRETTNERGDRNFQFSAMIEITPKAGD